MSDPARIDSKFPQHPKVKQCSLSAIGLWTLCNAGSREARSAGFVPDRAVVDRNAEAEAAELCKVRLWHIVDGGYRFNDWDEHNPDTIRKSTEGSAAWLVDSRIPHTHPVDVRSRLTGEVLKLINEGIRKSVIEASLDRWLTRDGAPPSWLPMMVSDVVRQSSDSIGALLTECFESGDVTPLLKYGHSFEPPDIPLDMDLAGVREFMLAAKREWITQIRQGLK